MDNTTQSIEYTDQLDLPRPDNTDDDRSAEEEEALYADYGLEAVSQYTEPQPTSSPKLPVQARGIPCNEVEKRIDDGMLSDRP